MLLIKVSIIFLDNFILEMFYNTESLTKDLTDCDKNSCQHCYFLIKLNNIILNHCVLDAFTEVSSLLKCIKQFHHNKRL